MALVTEIAESIKLMGEVIKNTREFINAVNDGRAYLKRYHPDAQKDLTDLLQQMRQAIVGLASVTKVISGFRFSVTGTSVDQESAQRDVSRLNDYLIDQREKSSALQGKISELKANCEKVRELRDKLDARTSSHSWGSMFELFGTKSRERSLKLHTALDTFYTEDQRMVDLLRETLKLADEALDEVENALGPPGTINPNNVPAAAQVLGRYSDLFRSTDKALRDLADNMNEVRIAIAS